MVHLFLDVVSLWNGQGVKDEVVVPVTTLVSVVESQAIGPVNALTLLIGEVVADRGHLVEAALGHLVEAALVPDRVLPTIALDLGHSLDHDHVLLTIALGLGHGLDLDHRDAEVGREEGGATAAVALGRPGDVAIMRVAVAVDRVHLGPGRRLALGRGRGLDPGLSQCRGRGLGRDLGLGLSRGRRIGSGRGRTLRVVDHLGQNRQHSISQRLTR
jgi:hypothetical protein